MELRNCKRCGQVFLYNEVRNICPECVEKEEQDFEAVKKYLWDYPNSSLVEVSEATGVKEEQILKYLREGRIILGDNSQMRLECEICGMQITYGRICSACNKALAGDTTSPPNNKGKKPEQDANRYKKERLFTEDLLKDKRDNS